MFHIIEPLVQKNFSFSVFCMLLYIFLCVYIYHYIPTYVYVILHIISSAHFLLFTNGYMYENKSERILTFPNGMITFQKHFQGTYIILTDLTIKRTHAISVANKKKLYYETLYHNILCAAKLWCGRKKGNDKD